MGAAFLPRLWERHLFLAGVGDTLRKRHPTRPCEPRGSDVCLKRCGSDPAAIAARCRSHKIESRQDAAPTRSNRGKMPLPQDEPRQECRSHKLGRRVAMCRQTTIKTGIFVAARSGLLNNAPAVLIPTEELPKMTKTALRASALVLALGLAAGCATTDTDAMNAASAAQSSADAAAAAAESARSSADRAAQSAASAQRTADQALSAAAKAQASADANKEAMERMFQKSMSK